MKVVYVTQKMQAEKTGGHHTFILQIKRICEELGIEFSLVKSEIKTNLLENKDSKWEYEKNALVNYWSVLQKLEKICPDVVFYGNLGYRFLSLWYDKTIYYAHYIPHLWDKKAISEMRQFMFELPLMVVPTKECIERIIRVFPYAIPKELVVIPLCIDLQTFGVDRERPIKFDVLWTGHWHLIRRIDEVLSIIRDLKKIKFLLVFPWEEEAKKVEALNLSNVETRFSLNRNEMAQAFMESKVYWNYSLTDTFSYPALEAMASGRALVLPNIPDYFHIKGKKVLFADDETVYQCLETAVKSWDGFIDVNREFIRENYSFAVMKEGYTRLLGRWM